MKGDAAGLTFHASPEGSLVIGLTGAWKTDRPLPSAEDVEKKVSAGRLRQVVFDTASLTDWDSSLLTFLLRVRAICSEKGIAFEMDGLPEGARRLLKLALAVPERAGARKEALEKKRSFPGLAGQTTQFAGSLTEVMDFLGGAGVAVARLFTGRATLRWSDLLAVHAGGGSQAVPIVSLISLLVGLILAFVGAIQLKAFGAQIYVADLVGIAMVRVMGAIMTGIIMAGRTGAAFAAQLGTMQVNEEIDALKPWGWSLWSSSSCPGWLPSRS